MAVAVLRDTRMRLAEYKEWLAARPEGERWELIDGGPVLMPPPAYRHQQIVSNLEAALRRRARPRGCWALSDLAVLSDAFDDYAPNPDVVVQCGEPPWTATPAIRSTSSKSFGRRPWCSIALPELACDLSVADIDARLAGRAAPVCQAPAGC